MVDFQSRFGQSLVELLVGIAIAAVFVIGAAVIIAPSLQIGKQTALVQTKTELANEVLDNVKAWAAGNWNSILALATGTANTYYLNTATSSFASSGAGAIQSVAVGSSTYTRYFYLSDVYRDSNGNVTTTASGNSYDPSTKLVTVIVQVSSTQISPSTTLYFYLTRNESNNFNQISWAGGSGQSNPVTLVGNNYASSSNVSINATGSIQLSTGGSSCIL